MNNVLASSLDIMYADRIRDVDKKSISVYSKPFGEEEVQSQLNVWASEGKIEIIKNLVDCDNDEYCIRLLTWIQPRGSDGGPLNMG